MGDQHGREKGALGSGQEQQRGHDRGGGGAFAQVEVERQQEEQGEEVDLHPHIEVVVGDRGIEGDQGDRQRRGGPGPEPNQQFRGERGRAQHAEQAEPVLPGRCLIAAQDHEDAAQHGEERGREAHDPFAGVVDEAVALRQVAGVAEHDQLVLELQPQGEVGDQAGGKPGAEDAEGGPREQGNASRALC